MPKETVHDQAAMYDVRIGWMAGDAGYVQVGVETADGRAIVDWLVKKPSDEVRQTLDRLTGSGEVAAFTGLWGTLDRDGCNRLIRALRRARDQAFGADA
jgi:hypothetical protein